MTVFFYKNVSLEERVAGIQTGFSLSSVGQFFWLDGHIIPDIVTWAEKRMNEHFQFTLIYVHEYIRDEKYELIN